jgi:hypothetical protein
MISAIESLFKICLQHSSLFGSLVDLVHELNEHLLLDTSGFINLVNQSGQFSMTLVLIVLVDLLNVQVQIQLLNLGFSLSILLAIVLLR